jgi:hypothetical protein
MNKIQELLRLFVKKIMNTSFVNRWIIFIIDLLLCAFSYVVAIYIRSKVDPENPIPNVALWGSLYLFYNAVFFCCFQT